MDPDQQKYVDLNRKAWNQFTGIHLQSDFYDVDSFLKGKSTLNETELSELGPLKNKSILHLQCHFGLDTLSLERLGGHLTGVDISDESIEQARKLAKKADLKSRFITSNIYDLKNQLSDTFDLVFTSYGVLFWLPDLRRWAELIYSFLKPGGKFYIIEFHPFLDTFDEELQFIKYPYFNLSNVSPIEFHEKGTYADPTSTIESTIYGWPHSLSEVLNSLTDYGLEISFFHEFAYSHFNFLADMIEVSPGKYQNNQLLGRVPYMYSIMALKT